MEKKKSKRNCKNCYFSRLIAARLHCVKSPPDLDLKTGCARWPRVKPTDICGQFRYANQNPIGTDHWPKNDLPIYKDTDVFNPLKLKSKESGVR